MILFVTKIFDVLQLVRLIKEITEADCERKESAGPFVEVFDPSSAMFVCNKWDVVPIDEAEGMKKIVIDKLGKCWPGLEAKQVFFLSTKQVSGVLVPTFTIVTFMMLKRLEKFSLFSFV